MLDMSKAFDTIQRGSLLTDLEQVLDNDELHLISLLIDNVSYTVKLEGKLGLPFNTNIGSPQGDSASALFFITYLANSMKSDDNDIDAVILPSQLVDHDYSTTTTNSFFTVDQQYADDISWASTGQHILQDIEKRVSDKLAVRNLKINCTKTEKFTITRKGNDSWKNVNMLEACWGPKKTLTEELNKSHLEASSRSIRHKIREYLREMPVRNKRLRTVTCSDVLAEMAAAINSDRVALERSLNCTSSALESVTIPYLDETFEDEARVSVVYSPESSFHLQTADKTDGRRLPRTSSPIQLSWDGYNEDERREIWRKRVLMKKPILFRTYCSHRYPKKSYRGMNHRQTVRRNWPRRVLIDDPRCRTPHRRP
ncbi:putative endonucleasereverse transcriptase [Apostichopus japonicus]|uniref:Putative endonucleasereverse transcriptase n=1 Tax=Stichopus japonicus TaxID=307972 RepID=A0A2G8KVP9_STIJA|nr:putative endonucleasereverse transcriptase [Apostichopus japonicus]